LQLGRRLFAKDALAILVASADIAEQLDQLTQSRSLSCVPFLPTYRRTEFACIRPPERNDNLSFKVLYAGRIERNKGVFELLEIARRFGAEAHQNISFDICGAGSALEELKALSQKAGVDSTFLCHGHCNKQQMQQMFSQSHTVIVPTTTDFIEGFNQVVAEGILSGRPVITSAVCPAIAYLHNAVVEVPPNDTKAYGDAILKLRDDQVLYEQKRQACLDMQEQFYDPANSWGIALKSVLESMP
jgi:glycosyltransferase involved in cell wall biosynthesis